MDYYLLRDPITSDDIDFVNDSSYDYVIFNSSVADNDSGWCDMATGGRIVTPHDRIIFKIVSPQQLTFLNLKYHHRLEKLPDLPESA